MNKKLDWNKAKLDLEYKKFQWYAEILGNLIDGIDDQFIESYDNKDIKGCRHAISSMSDVLNSYEGNKVYHDWRHRNEKRS
jgi:hypothetical protein